MKTRTLYYLTDLCLAITFAASLVTGLIKFPNLLNTLGLDHRRMQAYGLNFIHDWAGILLIALVVLHLLLHSKWIVASTKSMLGKK